MCGGHEIPQAPNLHSGITIPVSSLGYPVSTSCKKKKTKKKAVWGQFGVRSIFCLPGIRKTPWKMLLGDWSKTASVLLMLQQSGSLHHFEGGRISNLWRNNFKNLHWTKSLKKHGTSSISSTNCVQLCFNISPSMIPGLFRWSQIAP